MSTARRSARGLAGLAAALLVAATVAHAESQAWDRTIDRVAPSIVTIEIDQARAFDTEWNESSQATGFVVDAERGLILTNRHVVTPGPVVATAVFQNREEVELKPVYRDPVHDFGIYRYDPAKLRYAKPASLPLDPAGARIGVEIRVVGNDAGEQLAILAGTIARLDRAAPDYGVGKYNDFNTFYIQAASGTSGGSSGSPVIDIRGSVVALNAGGSNGAAASFFLPLDRVVRAIRLIQAGRPVTRGTIETIFDYTPYDELVRLGLRPATEAEARRTFPGLTGMLVVSEVQAGSAAETALEPGDVLVRVNGRMVATFDPLEQVLDDSVGKPVTLEVERGGQLLERTLTVRDLNSITPSRYLEFGDSVVHGLSYQMARHMNSPIQGVFVANPGYALAAAGIGRGAVIKSAGGQPIATLDDFERVISTLPDGERIAIRYSTLDDPKGSETKLMRMDWRWFPARDCTRDDAAGVWTCRELAAPPPSAKAAPARTSYAATGDALVDRIAPSLAFVTFDMPYSVEGVTERSYHGTGVVVDAARGLVAIDRNTVPVAVGDVGLTFGGSVEVPGRVVYVHPLHNVAIVAYDPALLDGTPVRSAEFDTRPLEAGEAVTVVGLTGDSRLQSLATTVAAVDDVSFPLSRTLQFRDANLEVATLVNGPTSFDGVVAGKDGRVRALWSSFAYEGGRDLSQVSRGMPAEIVAEAVTAARDGRPVYSLEAEFDTVTIAGARKVGLSDAWVRRLEQEGGAHRQVLRVNRLVAGSPAATELRPGDLLLAVDGRPVSRFREVELATQAPSVALTILRDGAEQQLAVATVALDGRGLDRLLVWAGAVLHAPHRAMAAQRAIPPEGVFVAYFSYGSPSTRYGLFAGRRIVEVDGKPTPDLDAFIAAVRGRPDRAPVRLKTITWNGTVEVVTLKLDLRYWPTYELVRRPDGWERVTVD
ncbi:MAG: PDZ domain-containing protein [Steroidobacteraceae bacterium]